MRRDAGDRDVKPPRALMATVRDFLAALAAISLVVAIRQNLVVWLVASVASFLAALYLNYHSKP